MPKPSKVMQLDVQMISSASELDGDVSSPSASQESAVVGIAFAMYGLRLAGDIKICRKVRFAV